MKKLIVLIILVAAAWYGWKHYPELLNRQPSHEAVVENASGTTLIRVRVSVGGQTFVKEELADGEKVTFPFKIKDDATFDLVWQWQARAGESSWHGGMVPRGPMVQRHVMSIDGDGQVMYHAEQKGSAVP